MNKRVVITGMGVVAPNGNGLDNYEEALRQGRSGIRFIEKLRDLKFGCQVGGSHKALTKWRRPIFRPKSAWR